jgi:hypothetical protein
MQEAQEQVSAAALLGLFTQAPIDGVIAGRADADCLESWILATTASREVAEGAWVLASTASRR